MLLAVCSAIVATACVVASGRRLAWAIAPMGLHPRVIQKALDGIDGVSVRNGLRRELARGDSRFVWERELFDAFDEPEGLVREARINEQIIELEGRTERWSRVPRVCASIGTSAGFLLASIALVQGLDVPNGEDGAGAVAIEGALYSALGALSLGIAATSFCAAVHVRAAKVSRERRAAIDQLVERLERLRSMSDGQTGGA